MQNKYFGDKHDFYKFHFLRRIATANSLGIHWCLVPDDTLNTGNEPLTDKERDLNPELYHLLNDCRNHNKRDVRNIENWFNKNMQHGVKYFTQMHEHYSNDLEYEENAIETLCSQDIIFFDPDNGIEVDSTTNKDKYKYVSYRLLKRFWDLGKSLVIFQYEGRNSKQTDGKIKILYKLLRKEPNIVTVKKGNVKYICAINSSVNIATGNGHYITLDVLADLQYRNIYKVENWRGTGGIG